MFFLELASYSIIIHNHSVHVKCDDCIFGICGVSRLRHQNGVISHEPDRIQAAQQSLKQLEKQCTTTTTATPTALTPSTPTTDTNDSRDLAVQAHFQSNWLSHVRYKIFGNVTSVNVTNDPKAKSPAQLIEEQVILGECYLLNAILLFLMQDITGYASKPILEPHRIGLSPTL